MAPPLLRPSLQIAPAERSSFVLPSLTVFSALVIWVLVRKLGIGLIPFLESLDKLSWLVVFTIAMVMLFAVFSIGHLIDLLSHTILERFLADKLDGFPHERIVPLKNSTRRYHRFLHRKRRNINRPTFFFEGAKLFIASCSAICFLGIVSRHPDLNAEYVRAIIKASIWYSVATLSYSLLLAIPPALVGYLPAATYKERRRFAIKLMRRLRSRVRSSRMHMVAIAPLLLINIGLVAPYVFIYDFVDKLVRGMFRLNKEIDSATYERIAKILKKKLNIDYSTIQNNDRYWLPYFLLMAGRPDVVQKIQGARSSATYCRNQALACLFAALLLAGVYRIDQQSIAGLLTRADIIHIALLLYLVAWIFHWRFLQQYYSCTKMALRAFGTLPEKSEKDGARKRAVKEKPTDIVQP